MKHRILAISNVNDLKNPFDQYVSTSENHEQIVRTSRSFSG